MEKATQPLSCKLTPPELQRRKAGVIADLKMYVLQRTELERGITYRFESKDEILDKLNEFIKTERMCCDFFTFHLTIEGSNAELAITGTDGAKAFLKDEIDL